MNLTSCTTKTPAGKLAKKLAALDKSIALQTRILASLEKCQINCDTTRQLCESLIERFTAMRKSLLA